MTTLRDELPYQRFLRTDFPLMSDNIRARYDNILKRCGGNVAIAYWVYKTAGIQRTLNFYIKTAKGYHKATTDDDSFSPVKLLSIWTDIDETNSFSKSTLVKQYKALKLYGKIAWGYTAKDFYRISFQSTKISKESQRAACAHHVIKEAHR